MKELVSTEYKHWLLDLKKRYKASQIKAAIKVNSELINFYWHLGKDIVEKKYDSKWGSKFYEKLSQDLKAEIPDAKGFSVTNLKYIKYFYEVFYEEVEIRRQLVDELTNIPWGHINLIINNCRKDSKKAVFFVHKTLENNWSRSVLLNFLDTDLYERQGHAVTNFPVTLPDVQSELAQEITKDPYSFDFLTLTEKYEEKELKDALIKNIFRCL